MQADRYSRFVGWLKVLLPLLALGLLSTLFLLSRAIDTETVIPFADKEIQDRLRDQQVTGPVYQSVTANGDQISFAAQKLTTPQGQTDGNEAEEIEINMELASGSTLMVTADRGVLDISQDTADLSGDVVITTSTGYRIESQKLTTLMSTTQVTSPGPVHADGPIGTLDAGAMTLNPAIDDEPAHLVFTNQVKLIYMPKQDEE
ncbi:LptC domain containing protein [Sulfitobacter noctilucicola]|uniref:Lipopolysaccharide export system protein LptC n=1 Tax=Sulfitobacter noctilucicola TaxID=1342301 RepID=A0A7W6M746_9RHOB|nr:LPS export ABC transporter periplasmic protein LptC [Sulfitobacter noctilucicola]KIN62751.1 LptC domain containing protein [Sulfitobacter noctilucicola]MBB4172716.1 lipopolysaccharide export system protein LptC [Sulfitobacter noctilucicola]